MNRNQELMYRITNHGLKTLDDVEVLEMLLGLRLNNESNRENAEILLNKHRSLENVIDASFEDLKNIPGFNEQYLFGLRLPREVADRYLFYKAKEKPIIDCTDAVLRYLEHSMRGLKIEHFKILYLNGRNMLITDEDLSKGTLTTASVYPREVIKSALRHNAAALIFAHNHPSGNIRPSQDDIKITNKLCDAANLLDIVVQDHIIIADNGYFSFSESGYMK